MFSAHYEGELEVVGVVPGEKLLETIEAAIEAHGVRKGMDNLICI